MRPHPEPLLRLRRTARTTVRRIRLLHRPPQRPTQPPSRPRRRHRQPPHGRNLHRRRRPSTRTPSRPTVDVHLVDLTKAERIDPPPAPTPTTTVRPAAAGLTSGTRSPPTSLLSTTHRRPSSHLTSTLEDPRHRPAPWPGARVASRRTESVRSCNACLRAGKGLVLVRERKRPLGSGPRRKLRRSCISLQGAGHRAGGDSPGAIRRGR